MHITDITGRIQPGMWNYEPPFPRFSMNPLGKVPWVDREVYCEVFHGLHSQTGTYLETPAHFYGNDQCYLTADIPVEKLVNIPCVILNMQEDYFSGQAERIPVTGEMLEACPGSRDIPPESAILIGTGWGKHWMDDAFLDKSPYFTCDAMKWLVSKLPFLLGTDFPRWENLQKPEGIFDVFYPADILMLAPCINIETIRSPRARLTVLPLNIKGTSCVPCRAVVVEDGD